MNVNCIEQVVGVKLVKQDRYHDARGFFQQLFPIPSFNPSQVNLSNSKKNVIRGLHVAPFSKLVSCIQGEIFDVVADVRPDSLTYLNWFGVSLNASESTQIYVPAGCAHGFYSAMDGSLVCYVQDATYQPDKEYAVHWKDPQLGIDWPAADQYILSKRDLEAKTLSELNTSTG